MRQAEMLRRLARHGYEAQPVVARRRDLHLVGAWVRTMHALKERGLARFGEVGGEVAGFITPRGREVLEES